MNQTAITHAVGALKLVPMFLNHPTIVSRATLIGATTEALEMLEALPPVTSELAEVFRLVDSVVQDGQVAYVTPTNSPERPYGAVVADMDGRLLATATGKTARGLAELIRLQLLPPAEGSGEQVA
jgi:phosphoenolpyruvate carboxylase